jgi:hypothetical protein
MGFVLERKKDFTPLDDGIYQAVCVGVYDVGTQTNKVDGKERHKLIIEWEIQTDNGLYYVHKTYTASLKPNSTLYKDLTSWVGEIESSFDLEKLLGLNAQLMVKSVDVNGKTYLNVVSVMGIPKTMKPIKPQKQPVLYTLEQGFTFPEGIPEWIQNVIKNSKEYQMFLDTVPFN